MTVTMVSRPKETDTVWDRNRLKRQMNTADLIRPRKTLSLLAFAHFLRKRRPSQAVECCDPATRQLPIGRDLMLKISRPLDPPAFGLTKLPLTAGATNTWPDPAARRFAGPRCLVESDGRASQTPYLTRASLSVEISRMQRGQGMNRQTRRDFIGSRDARPIFQEVVKLPRALPPLPLRG
jgi:hypothetical protein